MSAYRESALDRECAALAHLTDGRHQGLCHASFVLGQLVGAGKIGRDETERALFAAVHANGYVKKRGASAARSTIRSGLDSGATKPRQINGRQRPSTRGADMVKASPELTQGDDEAEREQAKAQWLWRLGEPIGDNPPAPYLRGARGYGGVIPPILRFLPAGDGHPPALMAAFGMATEPEPGVLAIADVDVRAVQLIKLRPDGSGKADVKPQKIIIGKGALGVPIIVAAPNDLLGLAITEGLEDALSIYQATGLGAWAAGGAGRMPALADAVPDYIDFVTIVADHDPAGVRGAEGLADGLRERRIKHKVSPLEGSAPA
jgi:Toprim domain